MRKRVNLPDFGKYFRTKSRSPIDFVCRDAPNLLHDMIFLRSYIHDAKFEIGSVRLNGETLHIPMQRDRWERYKASGNLESIAAQLVISRVLTIKWESVTKERRRRDSSHQFFVRDVYLGESYWDQSDKGEIVIAGFGKNPPKLRIFVRDPFSFRLTDVESKK
jgi:hypothetical protein